MSDADEISVDELFERIARLRDHLQRVDPIISEFCEAHGFQRVNPTSIGRYPRIRIEKVDELHRWFDLSMELDHEGKRYIEFFETIPYEMSAGCFVDFPDGTGGIHRFHKLYACFVNKPFELVPAILRDELEKNLEVINPWTVDCLRSEGRRQDIRVR
jgi:hypothetical protein